MIAGYNNNNADKAGSKRSKVSKKPKKICPIIININNFYINHNFMLLFLFIMSHANQRLSELTRECVYFAWIMIKFVDIPRKEIHVIYLPHAWCLKPGMPECYTL